MPEQEVAAAAGAENGTFGLKGVWWTNLANTSALVLFGVVFLWQFSSQNSQDREERAYFREELRVTRAESTAREDAIRDEANRRAAENAAQVAAVTQGIRSLEAQINVLNVSIGSLAVEVRKNTMARPPGQ